MHIYSFYSLQFTTMNVYEKDNEFARTIDIFLTKNFSKNYDGCFFSVVDVRKIFEFSTEFVAC